MRSENSDGPDGGLISLDMTKVGLMLFNSASHPLLVLSGHTSDIGGTKVVFANEAFARLVPGDGTSIVGGLLTDILSAESVANLQSNCHSGAHKLKVTHQSLELLDENASTDWVGTFGFISHDADNQYFLLSLEKSPDSAETLVSREDLLARAHTLVWQATAKLVDGAIEWAISTRDEAGAARWLPIDRQPNERFGTAWSRARNPVDDAMAQVNSFEAITTGRSGYSQTFRMNLVDGTVRWLAEDVRIRRVSHTEFELVGVCTDVTEQKTLELEQFQRDQRLGLHALQSGIGFVEWKTGQGISSCNQMFEELFGVSEAEISGEDVAVVVANGDFLATQTLNQLVSRDGIHDATIEHRRTDGTSLICEWKITPMIDLDGVMIGHMALVQNVTDRVNAERLLQRESNLLNALMDNMPDAIYIKDSESRFLKISQRMARSTLGLNDASEAIGKTDFDFFTAEHAQPAYDDELEIINTGEPILNKIEKETHADGTISWAQSTKAPIYDYDGEIIGTVGISRDITEQVLQEENRRRTEIESVTVMASANCLVWRADVWNEDGTLRWNIELSNTEAALRRLPIPYKTDDCFAENWLRAIHPDDVARNIATGNNAVRNGLDNYDQEFRIRLESGEIRWVAENVSIEKLDNEEHFRLVGVCIDITENKNSALELSHLVHSARCILWHGTVAFENGSWSWRTEFSDAETALRWLPIPLLPGESPESCWVHAVLPSDRIEINATSDAALNSGASGYEQEFRIRLEDGRIVWIAESVHIDYLESGHKRVVGVCMDVTKRKQSDADQRHLITNLQCLVWHGTLTIYDGDPKLELEIVNQETTRRWLKVACKTGGRLEEAWLAARPAEDAEHANQTCLSALARGASSYVHEFRSQLEDGRYLWLSEEVQLEQIAEGRWTAVGVCSDVTPYKEAQQRLAYERNLLRTLIDNLPDAIFAKDLQGRFTLVNTAQSRTLGARDQADCIGKSDEEFYSKSKADSFRADEIGVIESGIPILSHEEPSAGANGSVRWVSTSKVPVKDDAGRVTGLVGVSRDITIQKTVEHEREKMLAEALERADRDPLTGLLNHRAFHKRLEEESERSTRQGVPLAIAVLDLDNFKFFNDAYGHSVGDEVLCQLARALRSCCRTYDILARFGGDEFALLMPGTGPVEAKLMEERLRYGLDGAGYVPPGYNVSIPLSVSIGISVFPLDASNRLDALAIADERLIRSKTGGSERAEQSEQVRLVLSDTAPQFSMLNALISAVDNKDRYTRRHSDDVLEYSVQIAQELCMDEETQHIVQVAALLHDVGKIGVPDYILRKPGKLSDDEYGAIKQHPTMGAVIVGAVPGFENTLEAVRYHHERWDGKGYPEGLNGTNIPIIARLMAVADAYSAMTTDRPYRKGLSPSVALSRLISGAGSQWDEECVEALVKARRKHNEFPVTG